MKRRHFMAATVALGALVAPFSALADFPERDIRMIVPWGAGGGMDGIVRKITTLAEGALNGKAIYVENIEGGVSATGVGQLMNARPDGYTIGALTYDSVVTVPWQGMLPSYDMDKLRLIARLTSEADAVIVGSRTPYNSLEDLVAAAKAAPGKLRIGIQNMGGRIHLTLLQFQDLTGTQFKIVSYPGGAAAQKEALLSGEVDTVITSLGDFASLLEDGSARGLVEFSDTRNPTYDVPTAQELGIELENGSFIVLAAPAGTPDDVIAHIEGAYKTAYDSAEFQDWISRVGVTPNWLGSAEVGPWAQETAEGLFAQMDDLVKAGVLTK